LVSILYKKEKPKSAEIILEQSLMDSGNTLSRCVEINTGKDRIYIWRKSSNTKTGFNHTKITIIPKEILKISESKYIKELTRNEIKIYVQLTKISFFEHELGRFESEAFNNLKSIREISSKYSYDIPKFLKECKFYPWVSKFDSNKEHINLFQTSIFVEFILNSPKHGLELFENIQEKVNLLLRVINFVNDGDASYKSIGFNYLNNEEKFECNSSKNVKNKSGLNTYGISSTEYLDVINHIIGEVSNYNEDNLKIFLVISWRHLKFKKETDISIKIGLIHTTLIQLISYFCSNSNKISSKEIIEKTLKKLCISFDDELISNLKRFNENRNKIFKNIELDFKYDRQFNDSVKSAINLILELMIKYFQMENETLRISFRKIYKYVYLTGIKFDFMES